MSLLSGFVLVFETESSSTVQDSLELEIPLEQALWAEPPLLACSLVLSPTMYEVPGTGAKRWVRFPCEDST